VYQWGPNAFVYLQTWSELTGKPQLVAFDEDGEVRALSSVGNDQFTAGYGAGLAEPVESRITFQRDAAGHITSFIWQRGKNASRTAHRVDLERREDVTFSNGDVHLAGRLISPKTAGRHPAIVLVHASGAEDREYLLPMAHFLIRHGFAILGYDKRGVGESTGDWNSASFDDLAGDVIAAVSYLRSRKDIDGLHIGLFGWSQAGWVMPIAAVRSKNVAFLISVSGAGIPASETTLDQARNEMTARGMPAQTIENIVGLMKLQYRFAQTGLGWDDYATARQKLVTRMGSAPASFPGTQADPYWDFIRRLYFYDPQPILKQLTIPTLALFGELDNNISAEKNRAAWEAALKAGGNPDYTLRILPTADHMQLEAKTGSNAEMPSLSIFVPEYRETIEGWLSKHIRGWMP
jgi:pimeloyl-ACP methyl ester carboxylesterase